MDYEKIYLTNLNQNNRTTINTSNNNTKGLHTKQIENKSLDKNKTINSTCRNKSGTFPNYTKKK